MLDALAKKLGVEFRKKTALEAMLVETSINGERVILCKPQTFMNMSGRAVRTILKKNPIQDSDILVVYDDADLEFGDIRFRSGGSSGGHNGIQSVIDHFDHNVKRVRVGVGRPPHLDTELESWVLSKWGQDESEKLPEIINRAIEAIIEHVS